MNKNPLDQSLISYDLQKELKLKPSETTLRYILHLLSIPSEQRSELHLGTLKALTSNIKFFQKLIQENGPSIHEYICLFIKSEFFSRDEYVFHQGDIGDKLFIILFGSVKILIDNHGELLEVAKLGKGLSFGEVALIQNQPRNASIQCIEDSYFATLDKTSFDKTFGKLEAAKVKEGVKFLKSMPLFKDWTGKALEKFYFIFDKQKFCKGTILFKEGEEANCVYFIKQGEFQLLKLPQKNIPSQYTLRGNKRINAIIQNQSSLPTTVAIIGCRETIGDESINEDFYKYTCVCASETGEAWVLTKNDFIRRIRDERSINYLQEKNEIKHLIRTKTPTAVRRDITRTPDCKTKPIIWDNSNFRITRGSPRTLKKEKEKDLSITFVLKHIKTGLAPRKKVIGRRPSFKFKEKIAKDLSTYFKRIHYSPGTLKRLGINDI